MPFQGKILIRSLSFRVAAGRSRAPMAYIFLFTQIALPFLHTKVAVFSQPEIRYGHFPLTSMPLIQPSLILRNSSPRPFSNETSLMFILSLLFIS